MGGDYTRAVALRYLLLAIPLAAAMYRPVPRERVEILLLVSAVLWIMLSQTGPAARYARRAPEPWYGWMALYAARVHAFCGAACVIVYALVERPQRPLRDGSTWLAYAWVEDTGPSLLALGSGLAVYTGLSVAWALAVGSASRRIWGAIPPEPHLVRIRRRVSGGWPSAPRSQ